MSRGIPLDIVSEKYYHKNTEPFYRFSDLLSVNRFTRGKTYE